MYEHILLAVDLDHESSWSRALPVAIAEARAFDAALHVMTVVPDFGMSIVGQFFKPGYETAVMDAYNENLHAFVARHVPPEIRVQHIVGRGTIYEVILDVAKKVRADLIVMHAGRAELKDYLLGPNAARVVRHADCSVMVVRD